mmetsp:Transcript_9183/g.26400  ORF Transcript_9183/g.26400 Transcript_9183/m.26400 type:complete len:276 (-) Transcript_9183:97-924(-)
MWYTLLQSDNVAGHPVDVVADPADILAHAGQGVGETALDNAELLLQTCRLPSQQLRNLGRGSHRERVGGRRRRLHSHRVRHGRQLGHRRLRQRLGVPPQNMFVQILVRGEALWAVQTFSGGPLAASSVDLVPGAASSSSRMAGGRIPPRVRVAHGFQLRGLHSHLVHQRVQHLLGGRAHGTQKLQVQLRELQNLDEILVISVVNVLEREFGECEIVHVSLDRVDVALSDDPVQIQRMQQAPTELACPRPEYEPRRLLPKAEIAADASLQDFVRGR